MTGESTPIEASLALLIKDSDSRTRKEVIDENDGVSSTWLRTWKSNHKWPRKTARSLPSSNAEAST